MALIVQKYGGTSVADCERIEHVAGKVAATRAEGHDVVVVVSAMAGETDRLLGLAHRIMPRPSRRELDVLLATGEQVSIALLCIALGKLGLQARLPRIPRIGPSAPPRPGSCLRALGLSPPRGPRNSS